MTRRALVSQTRIPTFDRDSGSQDVETFIQFLLDAGWSVTFLSERCEVDHHHIRRLQQKGVATFLGYEHAVDVIAAGRFDLAIIAFWEPAAQLLPLLRTHAPDTHVIVNSMDLHFLRDARRNLAVRGELDARLGEQMVRELNVYHAADGVIAVSEEERTLLQLLLGRAAHHLPLAESFPRSSIPLAQRSGLIFVGNFRHLPNGEAVEHLCREVLPRLPDDLLAEHPLTVVGNQLDAKVRAHARDLTHVHMVGWVPSVRPYLERARVCVAPLLHGAGVKRKVLQALMSGTPVVTTPVGAEGLGLVHGEHALIAETAEDVARCVERLLTDDDRWHELADAGASHVGARHGLEVIRQRFWSIVDDVRAAPVRPAVVVDERMAIQQERDQSYRRSVQASREAVQVLTPPGATVLVVSRGDDALLEHPGRTGQHFPQTADGTWAGFHPADSAAAITHLEALRSRGADFLVVPATSSWWLDHYTALTEHLEVRHRRIHQDEHLAVFDLRDRPHVGRPHQVGAPRVLAIGQGTREDTPAARRIAAELDRTRRCEVTQWWPRTASDPRAPDERDFDWVIVLDDRAILPSSFVDDLVTTAEALAIERAQPTHIGGPEAGPPITERLHGCLGREVSAWTVLPVRLRRSGCPEDGPVVLLDTVNVGSGEPLVPAPPGHPDQVLDVFVADRDGGWGGVRGEPAAAPQLSVLIATYARPELLSAALDAFAEQTIDPGAFEVVVVDDGSPDARTRQVLEEHERRAPRLRWVSIAHAGRSAAKNLAVQLSRGGIVLFFDDDDRPCPSLVEAHLQAHADLGDERAAVLGRTTWAPELPVSALMHYVTDVDKLLFAYGNLTDGQELGWRWFWEGRISCHRSFLMDHALHDQRLDYSIDVEMAYRLARHGLRIHYREAAHSLMARPVTLDDFCQRSEAKGRAQAIITQLHDDAALRQAMDVEGAEERAALAENPHDWIEALRARESSVDRTDPAQMEELHRAYRQLFRSLNARGVQAILGRPGATDRVPPNRAPARPADPAAVLSSGAQPTALSGGAGEHGPAPELTVTLPVWSRTVELADMAERTIDRLWQVAALDIEVVVIDNGSPHQRDFHARVHRFEENRGVAVGWNAGIALARAPVVAVLNSDCTVEPGWDLALHEAATSERCIAFPYTDHGDGLGFRRPDQGGTAGWCFAMTVALYREIGPFDERFSPAFGEDTDYWHRAWEMGVELCPVPAARVHHVRRSTAGGDPLVDRLLQAHRYKYGWKHGVDPDRAPPYYHRDIVEYRSRTVTEVVR